MRLARMKEEKERLAAEEAERKRVCVIETFGFIGEVYFFTPQPLRAVRVLFSPMVSGRVGGRREIVCPGCISETVRCRKFILGRDIG